MVLDRAVLVVGIEKQMLASSAQIADIGIMFEL